MPPITSFLLSMKIYVFWIIIIYKSLLKTICDIQKKRFYKSYLLKPFPLRKRDISSGFIWKRIEIVILLITNFLLVFKTNISAEM